jgi:heavy metal sensor kinase
MRFAHNPFRFLRGLRFRLALSYMMFFALLLLMLGVVFREMLSGLQEKHEEDVLDEEWAAAKGYLQFGPVGPEWFYDKSDPDEAFAVERIRRVFLLTDAEGHRLQYQGYDAIGFDSHDYIKSIIKQGAKAKDIRVKTDNKGVAYIVRSGTLLDPNRQNRYPYFLAIARATGDDSHLLQEFTFRYFIIVPIAILISGLLGWFLARRALAPVNSVAEIAQRVTHSNLKTEIPTRGAGDELDRLIEAFNRMIERLSLSFTQIRQFSTDVSHELRTPLTIVRGQLEVALMTATSPEQYRDAMVNALEDVERLSNIVRALLMLSQAESGQLVLKKTEIDFVEVVRNMVEEYQIPAEAQGVHLAATLPGACPISADRIQIERLISNLVSNSIKYTPEGGNVRVEVNCEGGQAILTVSDNGVGIAPAHLPHIFDRFYRVPSSDPEKGLGLGLSFVAWIVKAHDGTIDVKSELNRGTNFTVTFPALTPEAPADSAETLTPAEQLN